MWKRYFKFVKLKPGKVVTTLLGEIDFSADNIGIEIIKALYESGFPYLEITEEGKAKLYEVEPIMGKDLTNDKSKRARKLEVISNSK